MDLREQLHDVRRRLHEEASDARMRLVSAERDLKRIPSDLSSMDDAQVEYLCWQLRLSGPRWPREEAV